MAILDISVAMRELLLKNNEIGALATGGIVSDRLPQLKQVPLIAYWIESEFAYDALDGPLGMDQPIFRIECYADDRITSSALRLLVRNHIGGYKGVITARVGTNVYSTFIKGVAQERGMVGGTDRVQIGTDQYRYIARQNFRVSYDSIE